MEQLFGGMFIDIKNAILPFAFIHSLLKHWVRIEVATEKTQGRG